MMRIFATLDRVWRVLYQRILTFRINSNEIINNAEHLTCSSDFPQSIWSITL